MRLSLLTIIAITVTLTKQDCLSSEVLTKLGYGGTIKTTPELITGAEVCATLFAEHGACVDVSEVKKMLEADQSSLLEKVEIRGNVVSVLNSILEFDTVKDSTTETTKVTTMRDALPTDHAACFKAMDHVSMGTICYLASGLASTGTSVSGSTLTLNVDQTTTGVALTKCNSWFDALCLTGTGYSISSELEIDDSDFQANSDYT